MHQEKGVTRSRDTGSCRGGCRNAELSCGSGYAGALVCSTVSQFALLGNGRVVLSSSTEPSWNWELTCACGERQGYGSRGPCAFLASPGSTSGSRVEE